MPILQVAVPLLAGAGQTLPHLPQLLVSLLVSVQVAPQQVRFMSVGQQL
jgi:hypothetical protein